jgi:hypothetical protein
MSNKNEHNDFYKYFLIIPILMLFASLGQWPYGYFTLQRWIVTIASIMILNKAFDQNIGWAKISFIVITVLFNPLVPVHLTREIWIPIDIIAGILFLFGYFKIIKK